MIDWFTSSASTGRRRVYAAPIARRRRACRLRPDRRKVYLIPQGIIHDSRMAPSTLGRQRDIDAIALLYEEDEWLGALAAKDEKAVWQKHDGSRTTTR